MSRLLFAPGVRGFIVVEIQNALRAAGADPGPSDGVYGQGTIAAVRNFQTAQSLDPTGLVDDDTWRSLTGDDIPPLEQRALQLTATFEAHGFGIAAGNWDGAWLTWGIIGFTMKYGKVQAILKQVDVVAPQRIDAAFGADAGQLRGILNAPAAQQQAWANSITVGRSLAEPWRTGFAILGTFPEVQQAQLGLVHSDYFLPSLNTAKRFQLTSELGQALCFDIHVQNGSISTAAAAEIKAATKASPPADEHALRVVIANAVADNAKAAYREDVRSRKLTIANGSGSVHGGNFVLSQWGLLDIAVAAVGG